MDDLISIHALLAESDPPRGGVLHYLMPNFYPRSPCGERRKPRRLKSRRMVFLSTLSLRRATSADCSCRNGRPDFYPRSPCGERPVLHGLQGLFVSDHFYPRSPCGERLARCRFWALSNAISIHALLAESDGNDFLNANRKPLFLSTLSLRRATYQHK